MNLSSFEAVGVAGTVLLEVRLPDGFLLGGFLSSAAPSLSNWYRLVSRVLAWCLVPRTLSSSEGSMVIFSQRAVAMNLPYFVAVGVAGLVLLVDRLPDGSLLVVFLISVCPSLAACYDLFSGVSAWCLVSATVV